MARIALLAGLALALAGSVAYAGDGVCKALVRGPAGDHVRVALTVAHGAVVAGDVVWSPVLTSAPGADASLFQQLDIRYMHAAAADRLGEPGEVGLTVTRQAGSINDLASASAQLVADDGDSWRGTTPGRFGALVRITFAVHVPEQHVNVHPDLLGRIETLAALTLHLRSAAGQEISSAHADLTAHAGRDELVRKAWAQADARAASPEPCA